MKILPFGSLSWVLSPILLTVVADYFSLELLLKPLHKRFCLQTWSFFGRWNILSNKKYRTITICRLDLKIDIGNSQNLLIFFFFWNRYWPNNPKCYAWLYAAFYFEIKATSLPSPPQKKVLQLNDVAICGQHLNLLYKMRYILWVVALLEACDVTKHGCHLGFYQELEIS